MNQNPIISIEPEKPDVSIEIKVSNEGEPGYTPQRGIDYWTDADKREIVDGVKQEIGELPGGGTVRSVNGKSPDKNGDVVVDPELPSAWEIPSSDPSDPMPYDKVLGTEFGGDGEPKWVLQSPPSAEAVRYTAQTLNVNQQAQARKNIGAQPAGDYALKSEIPSVAVQSVNGKTGDVVLTADDIGAAKKEDIDRLSEEIAELQYKTVTSYTLYASAVKDNENYWRIPATSENQLQSGEKYKIVVTAANDFSVDTLQVGTSSASHAMVDTIAQNISVKAGEQFEAEYFPTQDGLRYIRVFGASDKISSIDFYLLETKTVSTIPELDATLTEFGKAADAKAVGDRFSTQAKQIARLNEEVFIVPAGVNMIDPSTSVAGYIGGSGGAIIANAEYLTTDYIYIPAGRTISVTPKLRKFLAYKAANKEPIYASYVNNETANYVYTADAACYVRVSYWANNASSYKVEFVEDAPISLNIASFGDSIAFGDGNSGVGIADVVAQHMTATVWEYAKGGATIAWDAADAESESDTTKRQNIQYQVTKCISEHSQAPDIILLDGGTNDNGHGITLGEISDGYDAALDNTTYCGGLETIIKTLKSAYPEAILIFVLVHRMGSRDNAKQNSFANKAIEICNKWSVGLADVFHRSSLNTFLAAYQKYTNATTDAPNGDKTHPTQEGYEIFYLPIVMDEIKKLKLVD
jgi:lysophospholipase L1-like esterase